MYPSPPVILTEGGRTGEGGRMGPRPVLFCSRRRAQKGTREGRRDTLVGHASFPFSYRPYMCAAVVTEDTQREKVRQLQQRSGEEEDE